MKWFDKEEKVTDAMLETSGQSAMKSLVSSLSEEEPSMAWRSQLNEKLIAMESVKTKKKANRRLVTWTSSLGFGVAAAAFTFMFINAGSPMSRNVRTPVADSGSDFVRLHQESLAMASVSGAGVSERVTGLTSDSYEVDYDLL